jgi:hypothetical protein
MRYSCWLILGVWLASASVTEAQQQSTLARHLAAQERGLWDAVKQKNLGAFRAALAPAYAGVYADGVHDRAAELQVVASTRLRRFQMEDLQVHQPAGNTVVLTYKITEDGDIAGTALSGTYWASSVWHKAGRNWQTVLHTEARAQQ